MPLDPQAKALIDMMKSAPSFSALSPDEACKQTNAMRALRSANPEAVAKVEDRKISGPALLDKSVALLNEAMTASPERQVETRKKFDGIMREIDKIRLSNQN